MIKFDNVGLRYGSGEEVLCDLTFHIKAGSFHFLTGPSGAGKTSLLRLLFMNQRPTRGFISLFDKDITSIPRYKLPEFRRQIGVVFQDFRLLNHLTTFENVALPLIVLGENSEDYQQNVIELLSWVGLSDRISAYPPVLSGGEQQRAAIARAVVTKPKLLLADEPTGNVDPALAKRLLRLFVELNKLGTTVIVATHDLNLLEQIDAPKLKLDHGRISVTNG